MNLLQQIEREQIQSLTKGKSMPNFRPGDTLRVHVKVVEGNRERTQAYEGVCIARKNAGLNSSFTVRKISFGEGVERVFPLHSPNITVEVVRHGDVRRAKLYYLRDRTGKSARIRERTFVPGSTDEAAASAAAMADLESTLTQELNNAETAEAVEAEVAVAEETTAEADKA